MIPKTFIASYGYPAVPCRVWIDTVERVAAEKIGGESVIYVRNFYKNYVAYTLAQSAERERAKP